MRSVLIIEDSEDISALAQMCLEDEGWQVYIAETGALGVATAAARLPSVILLDSGLPDCEGWEVLEKMRTIPALERTPVVLFSAAQDPRYQKMELRGQIPKPFNFRTLASELSALLAASDKEGTLEGS